MMNQFPIGAVALGITSLCVVHSPAMAQWVATDLSPSGVTSSFALGNSGSNQVGQSGSFAAIWSGSSGSYASLNPSMPINNILAAADGSRCLSASGTRQGGFARWSTKTYAGLWSGSASTWVNLHPGGIGASGNSIIYGVSQTQQVGTYDASGTRATLWSGTPESWIDLHPVSTPYGAPSSSAARATNGVHQVGYIFRTPPGVNHASLWSGSAASWTDLTPGGSASSDSIAWGISPDGTRVVGYFGTSLGTSNQRATLWTSDTGWATWASQSLHPAGATGSQALSTTDNEQVGYAVIGGAEHASLWQGTPGSWVDLHPLLSGLGVARSKAWSIRTDGNTTTIAGEAWSVDAANPNIRTVTKAFLLTRISCPSCPADFNQDGGVDGADVESFFTAWQDGDSCGDANQDGGVDGADVEFFFLTWEAGGCG